MKEPFRLIQGDWVASPDWLTLPQAIRARSPDDPARNCRVRVNREDVVKAALHRRRQPAYDFWCILNGKAPPVHHGLADADVELTTLYDAHALFKGMRRPIAEDPDGGNFLAYVLKPKWFFAYDTRPPVFTSYKDPVPDDLVFVAYVRLDEPSDTNLIKGVLTHWQFVEADPRNPLLPINCDDRYVRRLW